MHFRKKYITAGFEFGDAQINVSDPVKQINVLISKRPKTDTHPPLAADDGIAIVTCERELSSRLHDETVASGTLSAKREAIGRIAVEMHSLVVRTLRLARWRTSSETSPPNPIRWSVEFEWSFDGNNWKRVADFIQLSVELSMQPQWTNEDAEFVQTKALTDTDEPLGHEMQREAALNRKANPRSSMILALAAAEVGFKQFAARMLPDSAWILELPTAPLTEMLTKFPWAALKARISGKPAFVPDSIEKQLKKAVVLRNKVVHTGTVELKAETLDSIITSMRDFLYFLDALSGETWAARHISPAFLESFASPKSAP